MRPLLAGTVLRFTPLWAHAALFSLGQIASYFQNYNMVWTPMNELLVGAGFGLYAVVALVIAFDTWGLGTGRPFSFVFRLMLLLPFWAPAVGLMLYEDATLNMKVSMLLTVAIGIPIFGWWWFKPYRMLRKAKNSPNCS